MNEVPYELLRKYLEGGTNASENRQLIEWMLENKENARVMADTMSVISAAKVLGDERFDSRREAFLKRLSLSIDKQESEVVRKKRGKLIFAIAGGFAAAIVALSVFLFAPGKGYSFHTPQAYTSYSNTSNDSDIIYLPDGSTVWIMGGSTLRYGAVTAEGGQREVFLDGEAFFNVAKDTLHPFVVKTQELSVVAVGTRFNVCGREGENTEVMLEEGSVRLCNPQGVNLMRLCPGQTATLDEATGDIFIEQRYVQSEVRLKYNVIALTGATLDEIIGNIERSYGVRIEVRNMPDKGRRYNFSCLKNRGVEEALSILSHLTGAGFEIK